jgi:hypothetical protein
MTVQENIQRILSMPDEQFNSIMENIDKLLVAQDVGIPGRELRGSMLFSNQQGLSGVPLTHPVFQKVFDWFAARYGERLNLDMDFGQSALLLRGDILRFRCPYFAGRAYVISCPELMNRDFSGARRNLPGLINALSMINGMTSAYFRSLTAIEQNCLLEAFVESELSLARIKDANVQEYVRIASEDLQTSVERMTSPNPQFGLSKWASLQAVEKVIKAYISKQNVEPKKTHKLNDLAAAAESVGLRPLQRSSLKFVECSPDVRYPSTRVTKDEAVMAHRSAVAICADIAMQLPRIGWNTNIMGRTSLRLEGVDGIRPTILISRAKNDGIKSRPLVSETPSKA